MSKQEFLSGLRAKLSGLPQADIEDRLAFYGEMIDDRMEDGLSEEEAVSAIGTEDEIFAQIMADIPLSKLVKEKIKAKRKPSATTTVLLILGFPIWFSLAVSFFAVVLSLYFSLWSLIISLWAVFFSLAIAGIAAVAAGIVSLVLGNSITGLAAIGAGIICVGLSILTLLGSKAATKGTLILTKKTALWIKKCFIGKENLQ